MNSTDITVRDKGSLSDMKNVSPIVDADSHIKKGILGRTIRQEPQNESTIRGTSSKKRYPSLCNNCAQREAIDKFGDKRFCSVMVEAINGGTGVWNCAYFKRYAQ